MDPPLAPRAAAARAATYGPVMVAGAARNLGGRGLSVVAAAQGAAPVAALGPSPAPPAPAVEAQFARISPRRSTAAAPHRRLLTSAVWTHQAGPLAQASHPGKDRPVGRHHRRLHRD